MWIAHRINTIQEINTVNPETGIEFDVRDSDGKLIVQHDAFSDGVIFADFAKKIGKRFCIVNIKSEGIETKVLEILEVNNIVDFFLLDCSIPSMNKLTGIGENRIAVRFSELEPVEFVMCWKGKVKWIWVDCFTKHPITKELSLLFQQAGFNICLVSPDLHGRPEDIPTISRWVRNSGIHLNAICTKQHNMSLWGDVIMN